MWYYNEDSHASDVQPSGFNIGDKIILFDDDVSKVFKNPKCYAVITVDYSVVINQSL